MQRTSRINETMKREIGNIVLMEIKDPRVKLVTITAVNVSKDLQHARVYFSVLGNSQQTSEAQAGLDSARGYIRKLIGARVRMRYTPEIEFIYDETIEYSDRIERTLEDLKNESKKNS